MNYSKISGFSDEIDKSIVTQFSVLNRLGIKYFEPRGIDGKNISAKSKSLKICLINIRKRKKGKRRAENFRKRRFFLHFAENNACNLQSTLIL